MISSNLMTQFSDVVKEKEFQRLYKMNLFSTSLANEKLQLSNQSMQTSIQNFRDVVINSDITTLLLSLSC